MTIDEGQLEELHDLCDEVRVLTEGQHKFILLKGLCFLCGEEHVKMNALLCPQEHTGYVTRLFLERPLTGRGQSQNWQVHTILGNTWHVWSWKDVSSDQTLLEILTGHLDTFK